MSEPNPPVRGEIELTELLRSLLATRGYVVIAVSVVSMVFWSSLFVLNFNTPTIHSYQSRLVLSFSGAEKGAYPNGTEFVLGDIISPHVLNRVYEDNALEAFIGRREFGSGFSVSPYTPDRDLILGKYQLDTKNLSLAEIEESQDKLGQELARAAADSLILTFTSEHADEIPPALMYKVMMDVPEEWNRHRIGLGVLQFEKQIYSERVVNVELIQEADYFIAFEMVLDLISVLEDNINTVRSIPNSLSVIDPLSGYSITDLERVVRDIKMYQVGPLRGPVLSLGIARDVPAVRLYFSTRLSELKLNRGMTLARLRNVEKTYADYVQTEKFKSENSGEQASLSSGTMIPQFGAEFLDKVVELSSAGEDVSYRQNLNSLQLEVANNLAEADVEIKRVEKILSMLSRAAEFSEQENVLREKYSDRFHELIPVILQNLKDNFAISNRLADRLGEESLGIRGRLYRSADGEVLHSETRNVVNAGNIRTFAILVFLTIALVVPGAMVRSGLSRSKED